MSAIQAPAPSPTDKGDPQPPFDKHFHANHVPTSSEIVSVKILIDQQQAIVDGIDEEIAELDRRRKELVHRRQPHTDYIDTHCLVISPASSLHSDALLAIFLALVTAPKCDSEHCSQRNEVPPAVVLSQVCSQWRNLAMRNPLLWSYIDLYIPSAPSYRNSTATPADLDRYQAGLARWRHTTDMLRMRVEHLVEKSQGCPLRISVCAKHSRERQVTTEEIQAMQGEYLTRAITAVKLICKKGNEWKALRVHLTMADPTSPLMSLVCFSKIKERALESLEFDLGYDHHGTIPPEIWEQMGGRLDFRKSPITSLTTRMPYPDIRRFVLHWDRLTSFSFGSPNSNVPFRPHDACNILAATPNLVHCTIEFLDNAPHEPFAPLKQVLPLPYLEDLTFRGSPARVEFAALLDMPSLARLSAVYRSASAQDEKQSAIVEFVRRYGMQLTDVSFAYSSLTLSALGSVLEHLTKVTSLRLYSRECGPVSFNIQIGSGHAIGGRELLDARLDATLLQLLTPKLGEPSAEASVPECICPKLQTFICVLGEENEEGTKEALISLIQARKKAATMKGGGVASLDKVDVTFWAGPVDEILRNLKERGVDTFGVSFKARYAASHLTPCVYKMPVPGIGMIKMAMDHQH